MALTMRDILALFEPFGMSKDYVNNRLKKARDEGEAFNFFEGLKLEALVAWEELSPEQQEQHHRTHQRLQGLQLRNYKPPPTKDSEDMKKRLATAGVDKTVSMPPLPINVDDLSMPEVLALSKAIGARMRREFPGVVEMFEKKYGPLDPDKDKVS